MQKMSFLAVGILFLSLMTGCLTQSEYQIPDKREEQAEDPYSWDFGLIKESSILEHNFTLKNETENILTINEINSSCGCTVSKTEKKTLMPGEVTLIEVKFDTKGYSGPTQQYIYVNTDNLDNPILKFIIKADVIK